MNITEKTIQKATAKLLAINAKREKAKMNYLNFQLWIAFSLCKIDPRYIKANIGQDRVTFTFFGSNVPFYQDGSRYSNIFSNCRKVFSYSRVLKNWYSKMVETLVSNGVDLESAKDLVQSKTTAPTCKDCFFDPGSEHKDCGYPMLNCTRCARGDRYIFQNPIDKN